MGSVPFGAVFDNVNFVDRTKPQVGGSWPDEPRIFTDLPVGVHADRQCAEGVHIDAHVNVPGGPGADAVDSNYPRSCTAPLEGGEVSLAFSSTAPRASKTRRSRVPFRPYRVSDARLGHVRNEAAVGVNDEEAAGTVNFYGAFEARTDGST